MSDTYHITRREPGKRAKPKIISARNFKFNPDKLMAELNSNMAYNNRGIAQNQALGKAIIEYMEEEYTRDGVYKFSSNKVAEYCFNLRDTWNKTNVRTMLSRLKSEGILVNLKERVPDERTSYYFALASVLKVVTETINSDAHTTFLNGNNVTKQSIPQQTTTTPPNPFDAVNQSLKEIKAKVNDLSNSYLELVNALETKVTPPVADPVAIINFDGLANDIVVGINAELDAWLTKTDGSEDYKRGIKDGIRLAVEMGIILPDA